MTRKKLIGRSPFLNDRFAAAVKQFGLELVKTGSISHRGNKGTAREEALGKFFEERLPTKYAVTQGEVVDVFGRTSPQMDLMFYDQNVNFALNSEASSILPAEALLATIEVKSKLNKAEIYKSVVAAGKLRQLSPFGKPLLEKKAIADLGKRARYFHCIFAYETDLKEGGWLEAEAARFNDETGGNHLIDAVYVLERGTINLGHQIGRLEDDEGGAVTEFYFAVLNFIQREARRRGATPYDKYAKPAKPSWKRLT